MLTRALLFLNNKDCSVSIACTDSEWVRASCTVLTRDRMRPYI